MENTTAPALATTQEVMSAAAAFQDTLSSGLTHQQCQDDLMDELDEARRSEDIDWIRNVALQLLLVTKPEDC